MEDMILGNPDVRSILYQMNIIIYYLLFINDIPFIRLAIERACATVY